jgi:hypothetical protein
VDARPWLEKLRAELARRKLPPLYSERLLSELSDHVTDFLEDPMSTEVPADRGLFAGPCSAKEIAAAARVEFNKRHFCARHPLMVFAILPVVAVPLLWIAEMMGLFAIGTLLDAFGFGNADGTSPAWLTASLPYLAVETFVLPLAAGAALFCYLAERAAVRRIWPVLACSVIALFPALVFSDFVAHGESRGMLHGGRVRSADPEIQQHDRVIFGCGWRRPGAIDYLQISVPLVVFAWASCRRAKVRVSHVESASVSMHEGGNGGRTSLA